MIAYTEMPYTGDIVGWSKNQDRSTQQCPLTSR
jgi:hypothetical protein